MKISFCIPHMNRRVQLTKTLPTNLKDALSDICDYEFVLVDFLSWDGTIDWVLSQFSDAITTKRLKVISCPGLERFHMSVAKNTAHFYATGDILVNLDADNYIGKGGVRHVLKQFERYGLDIVFRQFSGQWGDGSSGRIACLRKYFHNIGGYDENFYPAGYQDIDLVERLKAKYNLQVIPEPCGAVQRNVNKFLGIGDRSTRFNKAIRNSKTLTVFDTNQELSYYEMNRCNDLTSKDNLSKGLFVANGGVYGLRKNALLYESSGKSRLIDPREYEL